MKGICKEALLLAGKLVGKKTNKYPTGTKVQVMAGKDTLGLIEIASPL